MKERESPSLIPWLVNQSRTLKGWIVFFSAILVLFNLYFLGIGLVTSYQMKGIFMVLCYILIYLTSMPKKRKRLPRVLHTITLLMALVGPLWVMGFENQLVARYYMAGPYDFYAFAICLVGLAALTLRTAAGIVAVILMAGATAYMFLGQYIPGIYGHGVLPLPWITTTLFTSINTGMFGSMSEMGARLISIFMVFASLLIISGLGEFFVGVAQGLFGRMTGGPAKVAVVNSALFGMISGSAVANVSATGSFTIPLMKQVGYSPIAAASIEATASIGGSLMPPIMGLAAFLMAEIVGVSYAHICVLAIIPAMFWYFCLFLNVHYTALRSRVPRWSPPLEQTKQTLKDTWHVALSIPVLIVAMYLFTQPEVAAFWSVFALFGLTFLRKKTRLSPAKVAGALVSYAKSFVPLFVLIVALDVFLGALMGTGVHLKIGTSLMSGINNWVLALCMVFLMCLLVGMISPHTITYIAVVSVAAPALVAAFHFDLLQVHMFVFYGGLLAGLTPPVCLPVFVAAAIAGSPPMKTGWMASLRSLPLWIMPFAILKNSLYLGVGTPALSLIIGCALVGYGIFIFVLGMAGYFKGDLNTLERGIAMLLGLFILQPFSAGPVLIAAVIASLAFLAYRFIVGGRVRQATRADSTA